MIFFAMNPSSRVTARKAWNDVNRTFNTVSFSLLLSSSRKNVFKRYFKVAALLKCAGEATELVENS